jgi:hypothetical protein
MALPWPYPMPQSSCAVWEPMLCSIGAIAGLDNGEELSGTMAFQVGNRLPNRRIEAGQLGHRVSGILCLAM